MPKYQVQIDGANFLIDMDGRVAKRGFITYRYVDADDPTAAEHAAAQMLREDPELRPLVRNDPGDPPVMTVLEIAELEPDDGLGEQPGRVWYEMKPRRWWQFWRR